MKNFDVEKNFGENFENVLKLKIFMQHFLYIFFLYHHSGFTGHYPSPSTGAICYYRAIKSANINGHVSAINFHLLIENQNGFPSLKRSLISFAEKRRS